MLRESLFGLFSPTHRSICIIIWVVLSAAHEVPMLREYEYASGPLSGWQCYQDNPNRILNSINMTDDELTVQSCTDFCQDYRYLGLGNRNECYCGDQLHNPLHIVAASSCNSTCAGNKAETCGGVYLIAIYSQTSTS